MNDDALIRQMAETIRAVFWLADANKPQILYISPAYDRLWGRDRERLYDHYDEFFESIHLDDRERVRSVVARCVSQEQFEIEYRIVRPDGEVRWVRDRGFLIRDQAGAPDRIAGFAEDMTERKQTELVLFEQKKLLEMTASGQPLEDCLTSVCASVSKLNPGTRACFLLADAQRQRFSRSITPDFPPSLGKGLKDAPINDLCIGTCGEAVYQGEPITCAHIASDDRWSQQWRDLCIAHGILACHSKPVIGSDGLPLGSLMLCFDQARLPTDWEYQLAEFGTHAASIVFERDRSNLALYHSEERFHAVVNQVIAGIAQTDLTGQFVLVNHRYCEIVGYSREELLHKRMQDIIHPDDLPRGSALFQQLVTEGREFEIEERYLRKDGSAVWVNNSMSIVRGESGKPQSAVAVVLNVSERVQLEAERRQAEAALHQSSAILNTINQATPTLIYVKDRQGRIQMANPALLRALGKPASEIIGYTDAEFYLNPEEAEVVMATDRRIMETGEIQVLEEVVELPEGRRTFLSTKSPYPDETGNIIGLIGVSFDITDRKRAEEALRDREQRLTIATEAAQLGVFEWKIPEDIAIWENEQMYEIYRHTRADGTVSSQDFFENYLHPDDAEAFRAQLSAAMQVGRLHQAVCRIRRKDGTIGWIEVNGQFEFAADGSPLRLIGVIADITDRKHTEQAIAADFNNMQQLHDLSTRLIFEDDIQVLFDEILAAAIAITQANAGSIQLLDAQTNELVVLAAQGVEQSVVDHFRRVDASCSTSCGIALKSGVRSYVDFDAPGVPDPDGALQIHVDAGLRSAQSTPLITRSGRAIGMLSTHWNHHRRRRC